MLKLYLGMVVGSILALAGVVMLLRHRSQATELSTRSISDAEKRFLAKRISRRSQVAGLIILIGVMIGLGDSLPWQKAPATFVVYWLIVIGLALWTILLALGDMAATAAHSARELNELHREKMQLEEQVKAYRDSRSNGLTE